MRLTYHEVADNRLRCSFISLLRSTYVGAKNSVVARKKKGERKGERSFMVACGCAEFMTREVLP